MTEIGRSPYYGMVLWKYWSGNHMDWQWRETHHKTLEIDALAVYNKRRLFCFHHCAKTPTQIFTSESFRRGRKSGSDSLRRPGTSGRETHWQNRDHR